MGGNFLLLAKAGENLLHAIPDFPAVCDQYGCKIQELTSHLFLKSVGFCGEIIYNTEIRYIPRNIEAILKMGIPHKAKEVK